MRLAIIADVHSNLEALRAVMVSIKAEGADGVVCAGDVVGYGARPNEACDVVRRSSMSTVLGNHDYAALAGDSSYMNPYAAKAALWTADRLDDDSRRFLQGLRIGESFTFGGKRVAMFHGSTESNTEYVYEEDLHEGMLARAKCDILTLGHTHVPFVRTYKAGIIVNPGSVGQPRDGDWRASFAILDTSEMKCGIRRCDYDIDGAARAIDSAGLPSFLADRLYSGK